MASKSLRELFDAASDIEDKKARDAFLDEACASDAVLRANLEELLRYGDSAGGFLADGRSAGSVVTGSIEEKLGDRIGRFKLVQKLGEGGCGVVYLAEQLEPVRRQVALKVIKLGMDTASMIARFEAERQALALMDHPAIARVLDAGATENGRPYFVMELVRGTRITEFCQQNNLSIVDRLKLFIQVCQAVQHAHQKGIIHRDLKPSNVLVTSHDGVPLPKVIDFGIAKATAGARLTDQAVFTRLEMFVGTPAYMSPEQADPLADDLDTRTDIYSLGVLLYELLTGKPPFDSNELLASGLDEMRRIIREKEPTKPSTSLRRTVLTQAAHSPPITAPSPLASDLDWIVLKALEKERQRRYETANDFAADIQRHLRDEPVVARPPSRIYLLQKTIRRNRSAFVVAATVALLLVASVVFAARDAVKTRRAEKLQREMRLKAQTSQQQSEQARKEADAANRVLTRSLFIREWLDAETLLDEGKIAAALAWFARAARDHPGDSAVQTRLLSLLTERTFVVPADRPLVHDSPANNAAFLAGGSYVATAERDGTVQLWPLNSRSSPLILSNRFEYPAVVAGPGTNLLLVDEARSVSLWDLNHEVGSVPLKHEVTQPLPASTDGRLAAIHDPESAYRVWDIAGLRPMGPSLSPALAFSTTVFSPDDKYLLGSEASSQLAAWDIFSGRLVWRTPQTPGFQGEGLVAAAVCPDGRSVVVSCWLPSGGELSGWTFEPELSPTAVPAIASSQGWVLDTRSTIGALCFSQDGHDLYVGDAEGHLGVVNLATHELHTLNAQHDGRVTWMGLSRDGQRLATTSLDGTARIWDTRMKSPDPIVITNAASVWDAKFSPDSRWFVCSGMGAAEMRDARSGALLKRLPLNQYVRDVDISRDGRRIVAGTADGRTIVWNSDTGAPLFPAIEGEQVDGVEFSPDGHCFLIMSSKAQVRLYETETGRQIGPTMTNFSRGVSATFNPDGHSLVIGTDNGRIEFWSVPDGRRMDKPARHKDVIWTARFSADGKLLLTASRDRTAALWDADTGKLLREFRHEEQVYDAEFSPDGTRIVTGDAGRKAHVWDVRTGQRLFSLPGHAGGVWYCEFSTDGQMLLTGDDAGNARLWEASSGLPLSGWVHNGSSLRCTHLSPDGRMALSAAAGGTVRLWPVVRAPLPAPGWLPDMAEALAGHRLRDDGAPEIVPAERWEALETSLRSQEGQDFYARWARWFLVERLNGHPATFMP